MEIFSFCHTLLLIQLAGEYCVTVIFTILHRPTNHLLAGIKRTKLYWQDLRINQLFLWLLGCRTKLKQTEVDCEFLKKCCETLTDENRRLQKEVQELKALKLSQQQPLFMHMPAATLTMCPSCERIGGVGSEGANPNKSPFSMAHPKPHFYNPFTNSSAAC